MYEVEAIKPSVIGEVGKMRGPGVKCAERLAIEALEPGKMVRIPKEAAKQGSISAWAVFVTNQKGQKVRIKSDETHWIAYMPALNPGKEMGE